MKKDLSTDYKELKEILSDGSNEVPYRDMGQQFLDDLHHRISEKNHHRPFSFLWQSLMSPAVAWGGAIATVIVIGALLGYQAGGGSSAPVSVRQQSGMNVEKVYVKQPDYEIDASDELPTFFSEPQEF